MAVASISYLFDELTVFTSNTVSLADDLLPWLTHLWFEYCCNTLTFHYKSNFKEMKNAIPTQWKTN